MSRIELHVGDRHIAIEASNVDTAARVAREMWALTADMAPRPAGFQAGSGGQVERADLPTYEAVHSGDLRMLP